MEKGMAIVKNDENLKDPLLFTKKLLDLRMEINLMVEGSFDNKMIFQQARDKSFTDFLNEQSFSSTYIAQYVDNEMKRGFKGISDFDVENRIKAIIELFQCLYGRDMFLKAYEREFANRLLNKTSLSNEHEESFLNKLKVECGATAVSKMVGMMKDITLSQSVLSEFVQTIGGTNTIDGVTFNVEILTNGTWP